MLTIIFYSLIFFSGILVAYVDWEWFFKEAISFKNVENPVSYLDFNKLLVDDRRSVWPMCACIFFNNIHTGLFHVQLPRK